MRMTPPQRAKLRDQCAEHSALNFPTVNLLALLDQLDEQEAELVQLRTIARCADTVSDGIAEFGEPIPEQVQALDEALDKWREAPDHKVWT